jgi:hypothetical protein
LGQWRDISSAEEWELSPRTLALWRAYFGVAEGAWPSPPSFRRISAAPWKPLSERLGLFWDLDEIFENGGLSLEQALQSYVRRFGVKESDVYHVVARLAVTGKRSRERRH